MESTATNIRMTTQEANAVFRLLSRDNPARSPSAPNETAMAQRIIAVAWAIAAARHDLNDLCALTVTKNTTSYLIRAAMGAAGSGRQHAADRGGALWNALRRLRDIGVVEAFHGYGDSRVGRNWMRAHNIDEQAFDALVNAISENMDALEMIFHGASCDEPKHDKERLIDMARRIVAQMTWRRYVPAQRCIRLARERAVVTNGDVTASYFDVALKPGHPLAQVEPLLPLVVDIAVWRMEPEDRLMVEDGGDIVIDVARRAFTVALGNVEMTIPFAEEAPGYEPTPSMAISYAQRMPVDALRTVFASPFASERDVEEMAAYARSCSNPGWTLGNDFAVYVDPRI